MDLKGVEKEFQEMEFRKNMKMQQEDYATELENELLEVSE